jgi:hypothetical protein
MKMLSLKLLAAGSALALTGIGAGAAVVCNDEGDCWRTKERYQYRPEFKVRVYDDNWKWEEKDGSKYRWREGRDGRGYWRGGVWIGF